MMGSLIYLTASRPDIQFSTCLCARYRANPKESHLITIKRIFRYLKGTPSLGLWYPKCSGFDLKRYSDSDYARCNMDRKSTTAEAEYVVAAGCCANILWMKSQFTDYDIIYEKVPIFCDNTSAIAISTIQFCTQEQSILMTSYHWDIERIPCESGDVAGLAHHSRTQLAFIIRISIYVKKAERRLMLPTLPVYHPNPSTAELSGELDFRGYGGRHTRVFVLGYDGLPATSKSRPPSPDFILGPKNPQTPPVPQGEDESEPLFIQTHDPNYVPEPIYPEYIPLEDDHEFPAEEQPLPPIDSPTAESPGYITESDLEEDPEGTRMMRERIGRMEEEEHLDTGRTLIPTSADEPVLTTDGNSSILYHLPPLPLTIGAGIYLPDPEFIIPSPELRGGCPWLGHGLHLLIYTFTTISWVSNPIQDSQDGIPPRLSLTAVMPHYLHLHLQRYTTSLPIHQTLYEIGGEFLDRPVRGQGIDYGFISTVDAEERRQGI
ncbi:hypothetical protein Tco_0268922 [Tanacetum coccineum]